MMQAETGKDIGSTQISARHEWHASPMHSAHQLQFFLPETLLKDYVLRRAITGKEILFRAPPLLIRLGNELQARVNVTIEIINECLRPLEFKRGHLPGMI